MDNVHLVGAELVSAASHRIAAAAEVMQSAAARIEHAFEQRRRWEEEFLQRLNEIDLRLAQADGRVQ